MGKHDDDAVEVRRHWEVLVGQRYVVEADDALEAVRVAMENTSEAPQPDLDTLAIEVRELRSEL